VKTIHTQVVEFIRAKYQQNLKKNMDVRSNLRIIKDDLSTFVTKVIDRAPMIMPMFVYINRDTNIQALDQANEDALIGMTLEEQGGADRD